MSHQPIIRAFFDQATNSVSYLLVDPATGIAAVIDPVLDFDAATGTVTTSTAQAIADVADQNGWRIAMVLETHAHADHLSAAPYFKAKTGAWVGIGEHIRAVQAIFMPIFALADATADGADFDRLLADGEQIGLGELTIQVIHTPGHTPADVTYMIGENAFIGDTLFMPDYGTARADFPGGDARTLYESIRRILSLPDATRLFLCHDYKAPGRDHYQWETSVAEQKSANIHVHDGIGADAFVAMRNARDATLAAPRLLLPSIQVNIRAGQFPPPLPNGARFLRTPVKFGPDGDYANMV